MDRRTPLALIAAVAIAAGLLLGFTGVGSDCGSAFQPDYSQSSTNDAIGGYGESADDCRDAVSARRPIAYGATGLGLVALIIAIALPAPTRRRSTGPA